MKTQRLYYNDPFLLEFEATITGRRERDGRIELILDRTAFYPTSGGQPHDLGSIDGVPLVDCYENEETGEVVHVLAGDPAGPRVRGSIDRERRLDHMQQHSGQHVLSQAFVETFGWQTLSFHLGAEDCSIDLPADSITREQAELAEAVANRVVGDNRPVQVCYIDSAEAAGAGLRKPTARSGEIRLIDISGFDRSACGGTHVRYTSEIGPVLITGTERVRKQTRVHFICGNRVLQYARRASRALEAISQTISAPPLESAAAVAALWEEWQRTRKRMEEMDARLLDAEAAGFPVADGVATGNFTGRGIDTLKQLALKICSRPGTVALLADHSDQLRVVFARSEDSTTDVAALLKRVLEKFGGRGGGRPNLAQGGGLTGSAEEILEFARQNLG